MNYGSDIQPSSEAGRYTIASTSFYDKRLCLWRYKSSTPKNHVVCHQKLHDNAKMEKVQNQIES